MQQQELRGKDAVPVCAKATARRERNEVFAVLLTGAAAAAEFGQRRGTECDLMARSRSVRARTAKSRDVLRGLSREELYVLNIRERDRSHRPVSACPSI